MARGALGTRFRRDRFFQLGLLLVGGVVLAALLTPWLAPFDPLTGDLRNAYLLEPGVRYLLGTDTQGRDVLSRVLYGAVTLGVALGLLAGYYGRSVDALVMRLADITLAFPTLLLLIAVAAAVRPSLPVVFVVIGIVGWAGMARLVRSQVLVLKRSEFVLAAQVIIAATLGIAGAIMAEAALSFVGLGAQPPTPSWGAMVADGRDLLRVAPWVSFAPGLAIGVAVLGFNLVGDALREVYDPKLEREP